MIRCIAVLLLISTVLPAVADPTAVRAALAGAEWPWRLTGTLLTPNQKVALFASRSGKTASIVEGQEIDGWTVVTVRPESATLAAAGVTRTMTLDGFRRDAPASEVNTEAQKAVAAQDILSRQIAVRDNLAKQEREHKIAFDALAEATRQMELRKKQP